MRLTHDPIADAAYLYLEDTPGATGYSHTYPCDPIEVRGMINLDFDQHNRLKGIELISAKQYLSPETLAEAATAWDVNEAEISALGSEYDSSIDMARIHVNHQIQGAQIARNYDCDPSEVGGEIRLSFDTLGLLRLVEVRDASRLLPAEFLRTAATVR